MKLADDCFGKPVRLTAERLAHILEHPEMQGLELELAEVCDNRRRYAVRDPMLPRACFTSSIRKQSLVANGSALWLSNLQNDAYVVTAYLTDQPKPGEELWPKK